MSVFLLLFYQINQHLSFGLIMNCKANFNILIHIHQLLNVYMMRYGRAAIRVQVVDYSSVAQNCAQPNLSLSHISSEPEMINQAKISRNAWNSSMFQIKKICKFRNKIEQQMNINQVIAFRLQIPCYPEWNVSNVKIEFTLLFQDHNHQQNKEMNHNIHSIQTITTRLEDLDTGIFHYYSINFHGDYLSRLNFTCFVALQSYELKVVSFESAFNSLKASYCGYDELIQRYEKQLGDNQDGLQFVYRHFCHKFRYHTLLLRLRVNQHLRHKKQISFFLPKYILENKGPVNLTGFFDMYSKFNSNKITLHGVEEQIKEIQNLNKQFVREVLTVMKKQLIDTQKLRKQFSTYQSFDKNIRFVELDQFQQMENLKNFNRYKVKEKFKKVRSSKKRVNSSYPIKLQSSQNEIYLTYSKKVLTRSSLRQSRSSQTKIPFLYEQHNMLIVICHGYLSSSFDMQMVKRGIQMHLPSARVLPSVSNELYTEGCIWQMGKRLAQQIVSFCQKNKMLLENIILNFVGHSMGGLIARACLKYLPSEIKKFGFYCSIATPHLGYKNGGLVQAGLWFLRKFVKKESYCLKQISGKQTGCEKSFIYQLSEEGSLKIFNKIILISSTQDKYVPWHSTQLVPSKQRQKYKQKEEEQIKIIKNIIKQQNLHRVDINFGLTGKDFETLIGRKAHVRLLVHYQIFQFLYCTIPNLFNILEY